jgi:hypothetical protein
VRQRRRRRRSIAQHSSIAQDEPLDSDADVRGAEEDDGEVEHRHDEDAGMEADPRDAERSALTASV